MARAWLRGVLPQQYTGVSDSSPSGTWANKAREHNNIIYHYLTKCLGYTAYDEVQPASDTWAGNPQTNDTDGAFSGSDYVFTTTSSKFTAGMVGEFIVVVDGTNEENTGVYLVTAYIDANNIEINFYTTAGTYPTAGSGISWWMLDYANAPNLPSASGASAYCILESPHATSPATIQLMYQGHTYPTSGDYASGSHKAGFGVCVVPGPASENWDAGGHAWTTAGDSRKHTRRFTMPRGRVDDIDHGRIFAYGDTDGEFLSIYTHFDGGAGTSHGCTIAVLTPLETVPTHDSKDLVVCSGPYHAASYTTNIARDAGDYGMDRSVVYASDQPCIAYWQDWTHASARLFATSMTGPNEYTGEYDALPIFVWSDPESDQNAFGLVGEFKPAHMVFTTALHLGNFKTFNTDQWFHLMLGVAWPWPGIPTYF